MLECTINFYGYDIYLFSNNFVRLKMAEKYMAEKKGHNFHLALFHFIYISNFNIFITEKKIFQYNIVELLQCDKIIFTEIYMFTFI
jgi:hypothetical protein